MKIRCTSFGMSTPLVLCGAFLGLHTKKGEVPPHMGPHRRCEGPTTHGHDSGGVVGPPAPSGRAVLSATFPHASAPSPSAAAAGHVTGRPSTEPLGHKGTPPHFSIPCYVLGDPEWAPGDTRRARRTTHPLPWHVRGHDRGRTHGLGGGFHRGYQSTPLPPFYHQSRPPCV